MAWHGLWLMAKGLAIVPGFSRSTDVVRFCNRALKGGTRVGPLKRIYGRPLRMSRRFTVEILWSSIVIHWRMFGRLSWWRRTFWFPSARLLFRL